MHALLVGDGTYIKGLGVNQSIDKDFLSLFKEKFNVIDVFLLTAFDKNQFDKLKHHLQNLKKEVYDPHDRIIVIHFDSDFYIDTQTVGINLTNLFTVWKEVDIPLSVMLYYTNNSGINKEINFICQHEHKKNRPTVVETFFNPGNYNPELTPTHVDLNVDQIEYHALSLMGTNRSHRFALYNHLKHLSNQIVLVIKKLKL